jgi:hypothetical protein
MERREWHVRRVGMQIASRECSSWCSAFVHLGNSTVFGNGVGLNAVSGGKILSYQNNQATGNFTDGAPTGVLSVK